MVGGSLASPFIKESMLWRFPLPPPAFLSEVAVAASIRMVSMLGSAGAEEGGGLFVFEFSSKQLDSLEVGRGSWSD
jgi:hypothetical protein